MKMLTYRRDGEKGCIMKKVALALTAVIATIAFVFVSVDMINTGDASNIGGAIALLVAALFCAAACRIIEDKERGWR